MTVVSASLRAFALGLAFAAMSASAQQKVLKFIPQADLRILDPITTTAYITRNHGYMVYDTLFATDAKFQVQPQMVDKWEMSADKLTYTFTLREGLKFHDGQPVRSADCIASVQRWAKRDALGQKLAEATDVMERGERQDLPAQAQEAVRAHARGARKAVVQRALHHAGAHRQDRCLPEHHGGDRLGSVQVREGRMGARQQGRLREEHRLRAAQRGALLGRWRQGREGRSRRVDLHPRFGHRRGRAQRRRGGLVGAASARSPAAAAQEQGYPRREHRPARLDRHHPLQFPAAAVQQSENAAGAALRHQPAGLRARHRGRREERAHVLFVLYLRDTAFLGDRRRTAEGQARLRALQDS